MTCSSLGKAATGHIWHYFKVFRTSVRRVQLSIMFEPSSEFLTFSNFCGIELLWNTGLNGHHRIILFLFLSFITLSNLQRRQEHAFRPHWGAYRYHLLGAALSRLLQTQLSGCVLVLSTAELPVNLQNRMGLGETIPASLHRVDLFKGVEEQEVLFQAA